MHYLRCDLEVAEIHGLSSVIAAKMQHGDDSADWYLTSESYLVFWDEERVKECKR